MEQTLEKEAGSVRADLSHLRHDIAANGAKVAANGAKVAASGAKVVKNVAEKIKQNPVKSALVGSGVAFGLGVLSSKLMKKKNNGSL